jgi:hypothetical protein
MARKRNPVSKKKFLTKAQRKKGIKYDDYYQRVKAMRPYFGEIFSAKAGYDLRRGPKAWTPAQKRKITRYYRVMAPRLGGGDFVVKRYRRPDHLKAAITASLQEEFLPGQRAAIFSVDKGEELQVKITRKRQVLVTRDGLDEQEFIFDRKAFLKDWKAEVERNLAQTDAKLFKVITGANKSKLTFTRAGLIDEIAGMVERYDIESIDASGFDDRFFGEWLNGLVGYKGVTMRQMKVRDTKHQAEVSERRLAHGRARAKRAKSYSQAELRSIRATGRGGRVK